MKIQLKHLTKKFKDVVAVQDVNCTIENGEMVCLLGPSGCGKSTTLAMIAGLEMPTEGAIYFDGQDMSGFEAEHRDIGMVFQDYALYPHMTASENIQFPLKMRSVKKKERLEKVNQIAEMLQITKLLHRKPGQLSGGQQQRVAIADALASNPGCLVLDEPTAMLDPASRKEVIKIAHELNQKEKMTIVLITHHTDEVVDADRIILMKEGEIVGDGTPEDIFGDIQLLQDVKMDIPPVVELGMRLKRRGIELDTPILREQDMIEAIDKLYRMKCGGSEDAER